MVRSSLLVSLAAAAATTVATTASSNILPGSFIVEFEPDHVSLGASLLPLSVSVLTAGLL